MSKWQCNFFTDMLMPIPAEVASWFVQRRPHSADTNTNNTNTNNADKNTNNADTCSSCQLVRSKEGA